MPALLHPLHPLLDLAAVQTELLQLVDADTVLVGHSLDNDLRSLHLEHGQVVDTATLYPDARGRPYRRALRVLVKEHFDATIQDGEHDSAIDAICSLRLLQVRYPHSRTQRSSRPAAVVKVFALTETLLPFPVLLFCAA